LEDGTRVRQWRDHIKTPDDIWDAIVEAAALPGSTSAPKLQPISTRIVMLQSGMRAPMGLKLQGPDLETLSRVAVEFEALLRTSPGINPPTVAADRVVGKPYLEIEVNREAASRYGLNVADVQSVLQAAVGGKQVSTTVQGRERYPIIVRYARETRDSIEALENVRLRTPQGAQIPLSSVADISYVRGPQMIKTEDTFLTAYVVFDKHPGWAEVEVVEKAREFLQKQIDAGELVLPSGVSYKFAGSWENQVRANATLMVVLPLALALIMVILQLQFRRFSTTLLVFSGVVVAWAGGFIMLWLWGQDWFLDFHLLGRSMREVFQVHGYNLSIAVWVGFLALFGIATDDGVVMATYLRQTFDRDRPTTRESVREAVVIAGKRRVRPCLMTTATTLLALLPVLTATGRGADVMIPMAIPSFGGMTIAIMTMFLVPVLYSLIEERRVRKKP
jgi:Cu(I)/Ag(I) efflux system membrane protein CusA/SilA